MSIELEATVGQRGEVVIPKPIREAYDLRPGMDVTFSVAGNRIILERSTDALADYLDALPKQPEPASVDWNKRHDARWE